jgi:hypothetical protein
MSEDARATFVFLGPSLPRGEAEKVLPLPVTWCPPIRRGDLPRALAAGARRVAIVDGEFGQSLAVSVTEIKSALARGVEVWGASSMGALRAAECAALGMRGVGWVYRGYASGMLEADDEVALLFNPWSGEAVTLPLVSFRWSLALAKAEGVVPPAAAPDLLAAARRVCYAERTLASLRSAARSQPWEEPMRALLDWMEREPLRADRKRLDALQLLDMLALELAPAVLETVP